MGILPSHRDCTRFGCIGKIASIPVLGRTPCEKFESGDEFCHEGSSPIWLGVRYSPFAICITRQAVITIIHPTLATRSATTQGRVGVTSQDLGREEQESEEPESKAQGGAEGEHGAELASGDTRQKSLASQTSLALAYSAASTTLNVSTISKLSKSDPHKDERSPRQQTPPGWNRAHTRVRVERRRGR
jgi:hypothetical protein